jgi:hypothetical protein
VQTPTQLDLLRDHGRELGKARGKDAAEHADRKSKGASVWQERALALLDEYGVDNGYRDFQSADFALYALTRGLEPAPDNRAFGGIIVTARQRGAITRVGFDSVANPAHHGSPKSVWRWTEAGRKKA